MRITLDLDDELLGRAREWARRDATSVSVVIECALRAGLPAERAGESAADGYRLRWRPVKGRLRPGLRIRDRALLFDRMEGRDPSSAG